MPISRKPKKRKKKKKAEQRINSTIGSLAVKIWSSHIFYSRSDGMLQENRARFSDIQHFGCPFHRVHSIPYADIVRQSCRDILAYWVKFLTAQFDKNICATLLLNFCACLVGRRVLKITFLRPILILKILSKLQSDKS